MDTSSSTLVIERDSSNSSSMVLLESLSAERGKIADICESHAFKNACQFVSTLKTYCSKTRTKYLESSIFEIICERYIQHFIQSFQSQVKSMVYSSSHHIKDQGSFELCSKVNSEFYQTLSKSSYDVINKVLKDGISRHAASEPTLCDSHDILMKANDMIMDSQNERDHNNSPVVTNCCRSYNNNKSSLHSSINSYSSKDTTTKEYRQSLKQIRKNSISSGYAKRSPSSKHNKNQDHKHSGNAFPPSSNKFISVLNNLCKKGALNKQSKVTLCCLYFFHIDLSKTC